MLPLSDLEGEERDSSESQCAVPTKATDKRGFQLMSARSLCRNSRMVHCTQLVKHIIGNLTARLSHRGFRLDRGRGREYPMFARLIHFTYEMDA